MNAPEPARQGWELRVGVWATQAQVLELQAQVARILCPDPQHPPPCPIPWQAHVVDLDPGAETYSALMEHVAIEQPGDG